MALSSYTFSQQVLEELPRNKMLDRMMYTISQNISVEGPVYRDQGSREERNQYGSEMVKLMIRIAHEEAKDFLEQGDSQAYYAFLTLALTVPLQEGLYIQYRGVTAPVCNEAANSGELIHKLGEASFNNFMQYLAGGERPFLVPCDQIDATREMKQIIRGYDNKIGIS